MPSSPPPPPSGTPRYALVFKTHAWDGFIARQFERYRSAIGAGDIYVCLDETNGQVGPIDAPVLRFTQADLIAMGLADRAERGSLIWWNTDYPAYLFYAKHPGYDYYVFCEYDTCIRRGIDPLVAEVAAASADFVALPTRTATGDWMWTPFHLGTYDQAALAGSLNCISIMSNRAIAMLYRRRIELTHLSEAGRVPFWPINEVFLATEIRRAGMKAMSLEDFGNADGYEWYPPHLESDLDADRTHVFLHPVLDTPRYMASLLKFSPLPGYFHPRARLGRALRRFPEYRRRLPRAFVARVLMRSREGYQYIAHRLQRAARRSVLIGKD